MAETNDVAGATGSLTINLDAIARNWKSLAGHVGQAECAAVVKADAYGLGACRVVPTLLNSGCTTFFVATLAEAEEIRPLVAGKGRIYVLDGLLPGATATAYADLGVTPVLSTLEEIGEWQSAAKQQALRLPAALHIDTGLNRLGLSPSDVDQLCTDRSIFDTIDLALVMSHLASADDPNAPENETQRSQFEATRAKLPPAPSSLAASDGLMLGSPYHFDVVRPGYALYGGQAFQGAPTPVEPVVTATAKLLQIRHLTKGACVGYSSTFRAANDMTIAIVSAGYADGVPRASSAATNDTGGCVAIAGHIAPIVGRVSMDLIAIDVANIPTDHLARGTDVELIGTTLSLEQVGAAAGTIGYEILTRLGRRFHRVYLEESDG